jgi:hypothetical protein
MKSIRRGERASAAGSSPSVVGVFARDYAEQRERRAAALAATLAAADEGAGKVSGADRASIQADSGPDAPGPFPAAARLPAPELIELIARAHLAVSLSGLRQLQQQLSLAASYWATLLAGSGAARGGGDRSSPSQDRVVAETRAYLRSVADLSLQEARALQLELERAGDGLRSLVAGRPADASGRVRRSRVKR